MKTFEGSPSATAHTRKDMSNAEWRMGKKEREARRERLDARG